jgi:hypothetical protein
LEYSYEEAKGWKRFLKRKNLVPQGHFYPEDNVSGTIEYYASADDAIKAYNSHL